MRLSSLLIGIAATAMAVPASAALPPQWQRVAELKAILENGALIDAFQGQMVDRIEYVRPDLYRVSAGQCFAYVKIVEKPLPSGMVGARRFEVVPHEVDCPAK